MQGLIMHQSYFTVMILDAIAHHYYHMLSIAANFLSTNEINKMMLVNKYSRAQLKIPFYMIKVNLSIFHFFSFC